MSENLPDEARAVSVGFQTIPTYDVLSFIPDLGHLKSCNNIVCF